MRSRLIRRFSALMCVILGCLAAGARDGSASGAEEEMRKRLAAYAPVALRADLSALTPSDRAALDRLVEAARMMDELYWRQMGRQALAARAAFSNAVTPLDRLYRDFILINYGPFDIRDGMRRFVEVDGDAGPRRPGAGFYPEDMTKAEFEGFVGRHPHLKKEFERHNTFIRRVDGALVALPYETIFLEDLEKASDALKEAAALVRNPTLRRYLSLRAEALTSGDFYASDMAWLDVRDNLLDIVIGPIETYDDALLGLKSSYEGAVMVKDVGESKMLDVYKQNLDGMSRALPVDERYKKDSVPAGNVLEVVNIVVFTGDFNAGIKTIAASLPNDERVIQEKGAKKQIYRNVMEAKFETILEPIARLFLAKRDQKKVTREAFITNVLMHELAHTLGLDYVEGDPNQTVRRALAERYSPIEEAKADVVGIYNLQYLRNRKILSAEEVEESYMTYLAGIFRSIRFGVEEAHGQGTALQLNYLIREGGIRFDRERGTFAVHGRKFEPAITSLAAELLNVEATGNYERAGELLSTLGVLDPDIRSLLEKTDGIPVDVTFTFAM